jgi:cyclopropane fatty-acyl-phospholipid synthase-like methyltransferase
MATSNPFDHSDQDQRAAELSERAATIQERGIFLGGPPKKFVSAGQTQLDILLDNGLTTDSQVLDVGCGCLRGGVWLIDYLQPGGYSGIEPNEEMLDAGREILLGRSVEDTNRPRFDLNDRFDFTVFGQSFDYVIARSVWTHASQEQVRTMLDQFDEVANPAGRFLTSIMRPRWYQRTGRQDGWLGKSHESDVPGMVHYRLGWIRKECARRGLKVEVLGPSVGQYWLRIERTSQDRQRLP